MSIIILLFVWGWVSCGILSAGYCYQYFQKEWPSLAEENRERDKRRAYLDIFFGYASLLTTFFMHQDKYGLYPLKAGEIFSYFDLNQRTKDTWR